MANTKLSDLTALTALTEDDVFYVVDDEDGTPVSYQISTPNLRAALLRQFAQTATVTVASTAAETTLLGAGQGSATLDAAYLNTIGKQLEFVAWGILSNVATPTLNLKVKFGSVVLAATGDVTLVTDQTNVQWELRACFATRATGATGNGFAHGIVRVASAFYPMSNTAVSSALDLTSALVCNVTADWSASDAGNTISAHLLNIFKPN